MTNSEAGLSTVEREPIAVIGTGYVGLVTAAGFAELGNGVWCVDIDAAKIERLRSGEVPIYEPGLGESLAAHRERLHFTTELAVALEHARILFVAVGTPTTYSGDADLSAVYTVVDTLPISDRHALVMKSTVPVGTGAAIRRRLERDGKGDYSYVSCPEFLKEGAALPDFRSPDRVVIGDDGGWGGDAVAELYAPLGAPLVRTDVASAEMIKLAANAFLATKISFINEIANVCEETGADVLEVARGMGLDERIGPHFLKPGVGYGGSCLPGNETVLVRHKGRTTQISFEQLWRRLSHDAAHDLASAGNDERDGGDPCHDGDKLGGDAGPDVIEPRDLQVLSYVPGASVPCFLPVAAATRRLYRGPVVAVRTKMGRRVTTTADHPWIISDGRGAPPEIKLASELGAEDWIPLTVGWDVREGGGQLAGVGVGAPRGVKAPRATPVSSGWRFDTRIGCEGANDTGPACGAGAFAPHSAAIGNADKAIWDKDEAERLEYLSMLFGCESVTVPGSSLRTSDPRQADEALRLLASVGVIGSLEVDDAPESAYTVRVGLSEYRQLEGDDTAWVRVTGTELSDFGGDVYSLEVVGAHTFVTTGGVAVHNCFPKDVSALKRIAGNSGYHFQLLTAVIEVNELQKRRVIAKLQKHLGSLVGKQVALLGLAFKAHTDDMREASSLVLSARLQADGATVKAYDPVAMDAARLLMPGVEFADSALAAVADADAVVLVTEWPEFAELDWDEVAGRVACKVLVDGRNFIDGERARAAGFIYEGVGR